VEEFQSKEEKLDCLVCNAGALLNQRTETSEGNEIGKLTNNLHFHYAKILIKIIMRFFVFFQMAPFQVYDLYILTMSLVYSSLLSCMFLSSIMLLHIT